MGSYDDIDHRLHGRIELLLEHGWQPADLAHFVKRRFTQRHQRLAIGLLARHARQSHAPDRAPHEWLAQLAELGAYDPSTGSVVGGHGVVTERWAKQEQLDLHEAMPLAVEVFLLLQQAGRLQVLGPVPSQWPASNKGLGAAATRPAASSAVDPKTLRTIRALLAKAESTDFEAEAEAFTAKAQEMMTRHSIDAAMLAAHAAGGGSHAGIVTRRVHVDNPYAEEKAVFLAILAGVNGVRCVWSEGPSFSTLVGFPVDVQLTELLFTSLLVQATHASAHATAHDTRQRTPRFRRAFLVSFAERIGERLEQAHTAGVHEAEAAYGSELAPVLASRAAAVDEAYEQTFPNTRPMKAKSYDAYGWHAGREAADRADLGAGAAITRG